MSGTITRGKLVRADFAQWDGKTSTATRLDSTGGTITGLAVGNEVDVLQVYGSGTDRTRASIVSASNFINTTKCVLVFAPGTWTIDDDLTLGSNFIIHVPAGCVFDVSTGKTLTFNGPVFTRHYTWTSGAGTVTTNGGIIGPHITSAESTAGVTPTNFAIASHEESGIVHPARYGGVSDATTQCATALANALLVCAQSKCPLYVGGGSGYLCNTNLTVPVGTGSMVDIIGSGWDNGGIKFTSSSVTTGLTYTGSSYDYSGSIQDTRIQCASGAKRCVTFTNLNHPRIVRCHLHGAAGAGVVYDTTLMGELASTLITSCGSSTEGSVEVFGDSTTWKWDHSRISGGDTTIGGLLIDKCYDVVMIGGAIESSGPPLKIGSKSDSSRGLVGGNINNVDFENPGTGNYYIDIGSGLSSSAKVIAWNITAAAGSLSGTASVSGAVRLNQCSNVTFDSCNWGVSGATAFHVLTSTTNLGVNIRPHRNMFGTSIPWVYVNGAQVKAAGPHHDWSSDSVPRGLNPSTIPTVTGATPSISIFAAQGGYYGQVSMSNAGATTVTALTGGERGMEIAIYAPNGNTTLTHSTSTADQFNCTGAANLTMASGKFYRFIHNGTLWVQV